MKNQAIDIFNKNFAQPFTTDGYSLLLDDVKDFVEAEATASTHKNPDENAVLFSPFCLLRIAALPYEMLGSLRTPKTLSLVDSILSQRKQLNDLKITIEDILHSLVPRLAEEETSLRRLTIKLKRDVHNGRVRGYCDADLDQISARLFQNDKSIFAKWHQLRNELEENELAIDSIFFEEQQV